jgi:hypothetical protein
MLVFLCGVWFTISGILSWNRDRDLLLNPPTSATIKQANEQNIAGRPVPRDAWVLLEWENSGQKIQRWGSFAGYESDTPATIGSTVAVHVDPADSNRWTASNAARSPVVFLFPAIACIGVALLALALAWWQRRRVMRTWRDGMVVPATVLGWQFTALAPRSRVAKCTLAQAEGEADDPRIFYVIVPRTVAAPEVGQTLRVLVPDRSSTSGRLPANWLQA